MKIKCVSRECRNLKRWARKRFPPSPLPRGTPPQPPSKKYRMLYTALGGIKGATFCSALQLSHRFKMLSWFYNGGFFGNYLCVGKMVASIAQEQALRSIGKAATSVLPPSTALSFFSIPKVPLTQVALVARPCAPDAQRADDSSSPRSRLAKCLKSESR